MKILLVSNYLFDRQESMLRFAAILNQELTKAGHEVRVAQPEAYFGCIKPSRSGLGKWLGYIDKFLIFPFVLRWTAKWADIVHICDHSNAMYMKVLSFVPSLITCHDMIAIRNSRGEVNATPLGLFGVQFQRMILEGLKDAKYIVCDSLATQSDLTRIAEIELDKTKVIYLGLNYLYSKMDLNDARCRVLALVNDMNMPFVIHVGSDSWYKNRFGVLEIFLKLTEYPHLKDLNLIFVGDPLSRKGHNFVCMHNLSDRVFVLNNIDNEDLRSLYSLASALVFPSLQEGFGWPVLEAQACGCPVFTSSRASLTEVGGNAAVYIEPDQPQLAAHIIAERWHDRHSMIQKGYENVNKFTTSSMVAKYIDTYNYLIKCR